MERNKKAIYDVPRNALHPQHQQRKDDCPHPRTISHCFPFSCWKGACFNFGKQGHKVNDGKEPTCRPPPQPKNPDCQMVQGQVFAMNKKDVELLHLLLKLLNAITVLMSGSTHSSGCPKFVYNLYVSSNTMSHVLVVSTPVEDTILSDHVYRPYIFSTEGHELSINLIVWDIQNFDAILGIDWLSAYHAKLVCFHNFLTFYLSEGHVVRFVGVKPSSPIVISAIRAVDCWNRDMKLFSLCKDRKPKLELRDIPIVWTFRMPFLISYQVCLCIENRVLPRFTSRHDLYF